MNREYWIKTLEGGGLSSHDLYNVLLGRDVGFLDSKDHAAPKYIVILPQTG
jgi:hypothetical protein